MQRKIFYTRRSKRPLIIVLALTGLCAAAFYMGVRTGQAMPAFFAAGPHVSAEKLASNGY